MHILLDTARNIHSTVTDDKIGDSAQMRIARSRYGTRHACGALSNDEIAVESVSVPIHNVTTWDSFYSAFHVNNNSRQLEKI